MKNFLQQAVFLAIIAAVFGGFYAIARYERKIEGKSDVAEASTNELVTYIQSSTTPSNEEDAPHAAPLSDGSTGNQQITIDDNPAPHTKNTTSSSSNNPPIPKYTTDPKAYIYPLSVGVPLTQKVTGPTAAGTAASVPVLLYHGEGNIDGKTPIEAFISQMQTLKKAGWNTITLRQFYNYMKNGIPVPDKSFVLTFDDGRKDSYYPVDPVLKQLDYTAVMFVITGFSMPDNGKTSDFYLSKDELTQMEKSGRWELQSHGKEDHRTYQIATSTPDGTATTTPGHFLSNRFTDQAGQLENENEFRQRITADLTLSKMTLEQDFGNPIYAFAYPFNDFGQDTANYPDAQRIIADIIPSVYTFTFYQTWPGEGEMFNSPDPNAYMVRRIEPDPRWTGDQLLAVLDGARARSLPYQQGDSFGTEWSGSWGNLQTGPTLVLSASSISTGASATLKGTSGWKDYSLTAYADWNQGSEASLIARHHDATHYLTCDFSQNTVYIEEHTNGKQNIIGKASYTSPQVAQNVALGMTVDGNAITCSLSGQPVVSALTSNTTLLSGGVGVQVWNPTYGTAEMHVRNVVVDTIKQ